MDDVHAVIVCWDVDPSEKRIWTYFNNIIIDKFFI